MGKTISHIKIQQVSIPFSTMTDHISSVISTLIYHHEQKRPAPKQYEPRRPEPKQSMALKQPYRHLPPIQAPCRPVHVDTFNKNVLGKRARVESTAVVQQVAPPVMTEEQKFELRIITTACGLIKKLCDDNAVFTRKVTNFDSKTKPAISIEEYVFRFINYTGHRIQKMVATMVLMDRLCIHMNIKMDLFNFHRIFASCFLLADKMEDDYPMLRSDMCFLAGISRGELGALEYYTFEHLNYNASVDRKAFFDYFNQLQELLDHHSKQISK